MPIETYFAPARRTERRVFKNQVEDISHSPIVNTLLRSVAGLMVVLNEDRQIVAINHTFLETVGISDAEEALGLRLGETLKCVHAHAEPNGCGTTPMCVTCGAAIAMMAAIEKNVKDERICALTTAGENGVDDICLKIKACPLMVDDHRWILLFARDITQEQFWVNLERTFFHDVNNSLASLIGFSEILAMQIPDDSAVCQIKDAALRLNSEIALQRSLSRDRHENYTVYRTHTSLDAIRRELEVLIDGLSALKGKNFESLWPDEDISLNTDSLLVSKVVGNMVINALEATPAGGKAILSVENNTENVIWKVWNQGHIAEKHQQRIFQRFFSTKSEKGRGLGTFSMKLFGERYLGGRVGFESAPESGTTFIFYQPKHLPAGSAV